MRRARRAWRAPPGAGDRGQHDGPGNERAVPAAHVAEASGAGDGEGAGGSHENAGQEGRTVDGTRMMSGALGDARNDGAGAGRR